MKYRPYIPKPKYSYDFYKGDEYKGTGTIKEVAAALGISWKSLHCYCTPGVNAKKPYERQWFKLRIEEDTE